jgi:hypothetical protein
MWLRGGVRYGSAFVVLSVLYGVLYAWLPDRRQWRMVDRAGRGDRCAAVDRSRGLAVFFTAAPAS